MKKNSVLTKTIAMVLIIMTVFSTMAVNFSASAMDMENASKKATKAVITTGAGQIPVVGKFISSALDPILSELFGIKSDNAAILEKLDEISAKLDELKATLDKDTQSILKNLNDAKRNEFNASMTSLRTMVSNNYKYLREVERDEGSDYMKAVMIAEMLDFDMNNSDKLEVLTETLTAYVNGTEFKTSDTQSIYEYVYSVNCDGSLLGGEAAMKASGYINSVNEIITDSYKLMALVLGEKLFVSDNFDSIMAAAETDPGLKAELKTITSEDLAKYNVKVNRNYWSELLSENYTKEYNKVFSLSEADSTVSKYNRMVLDNWFTYIREVRYTSDSVTIESVKLKSEMSCTTPNMCGIEDEDYMYSANSMVKKVTNNINSKLYSVLTKAELQNLYTHFMNSELLSRDENGNKLSLYDALKDFGFDFDYIEKSREEFLNESIGKFIASIYGEENIFYPVFGYEANYKTGLEIVRDRPATASFTGYMGKEPELTANTVTYYKLQYETEPFKLVPKLAPAITLIMYFEAA